MPLEPFNSGRKQGKTGQSKENANNRRKRVDAAPFSISFLPPREAARARRQVGRDPKGPIGFLIPAEKLFNSASLTSCSPCGSPHGSDKSDEKERLNCVLRVGRTIRGVADPLRWVPRQVNLVYSLTAKTPNQFSTESLILAQNERWRRG